MQKRANEALKLIWTRWNGCQLRTLPLTGECYWSWLYGNMQPCVGNEESKVVLWRAYGYNLMLYQFPIGGINIRTDMTTICASSQVFGV